MRRPTYVGYSGFESKYCVKATLVGSMRRKSYDRYRDLFKWLSPRMLYCMHNTAFHEQTLARHHCNTLRCPPAASTYKYDVYALGFRVNSAKRGTAAKQVTLLFGNCIHHLSLNLQSIVIASQRSNAVSANTCRYST